MELNEIIRTLRNFLEMNEEKFHRPVDIVRYRVRMGE